MLRIPSLRGSTRSGDAGFTMSEVLVALLVGGMVLVAVTSFNVFQLRTLRAQANQVDLQTTARAINDLFTREVRTAGMTETCNTNIAAIVSGSEDSLRFQRDLNNNGTASGSTEAEEDITYTFDTANNTVTRTDNNNTANNANSNDILLSGVDLAGSRFSYFDVNGKDITPASGALTPPASLNVRRVRVEVTLTDPRVEPALHAAATNNIDLRNVFFVARNPLCFTPTPTMPNAPTFPPTPGGPTNTPGTPGSTKTPTPVCVPDGGNCTEDSDCCSKKCHSGLDYCQIGQPTPVPSPAGSPTSVQLTSPSVTMTPTPTPCLKAGFCTLGGNECCGNEGYVCVIKGSSKNGICALSTPTPTLTHTPTITLTATPTLTRTSTTTRTRTPTCKPSGIGQSCFFPSQCCSGICNSSTHFCSTNNFTPTKTPTTKACVPSLGACTLNTQCCSGTCNTTLLCK